MINDVKKVIKMYRNKIFIYQMGKVGSTSLEESIENSVHMHTLYSNSECWVREAQLWGLLSPLQKIKRYVGSKLDRMIIRSNNEVKIITLVRDPVARDVSMFFQRLPYWYTHYLNANNYGKISRADGDEIIHESFNKSFDHDYSVTWFDKEIKRFTGIDVMEMEFNKDKGFGIAKRGKFSLLVLTLEKMEENHASGVIEEFVGQKFSLVKGRNEGGNKWYSDVYKRFRKNYKFEANYVNQKYSGGWVQKFYPEEDLNEFRKKWLTQSL